MAQIITHGVTVADFVKGAVAYVNEKGGDPAQALREYRNAKTGEAEDSDVDDGVDQIEVPNDNESDIARNLDAAMKVAAEFVEQRGGTVNLPDEDIDKIFLAVQGIPASDQSGVDSDTTEEELDEQEATEETEDKSA